VPDLAAIASEGSCYSCVGMTQVQALKIPILLRMLKSLDPMSQTEINELLDYGKCFACTGASMFEILELAILMKISEKLAETQPS
jgi:hypothetical protein